MFLKTLSVKGFKSFADPTVLELEPGITVVVGPNGSGKSNVVDAVTWVLGAQGPRSLRSDKMEDVIFAGTSTRPPLGRAEVSLTIDNSSGRLPVDMAEVTITRTLFRNGDSEYAINGTPCRLLDIQDLLSDSGVGRQRHMIIGQGQLDTVLSARPEDRRAVIEEAAGVLKHRRRRERAERRLAGAQENLERLGDLVREVRRQIRPLERQAAAARTHATVAEELRRVRLFVARSELADLTERQEDVARSLTTLRNEENQLHEAMDALDRSASQTAAELSSRREQDLARLLGRAQALVERARGTAAVARERSRALQAALDAAADTDVVSNLESEAARLAAELVAVEETVDRSVPEREALAEQLRGVHADQEAAAQSADDGDTSGAEEALAAARGRIELLRQAVAQSARSLEALDQRIAAQERRAAELAAGAETRRAREAQIAADGARRAEEASAAQAKAEAAAASLTEAQRTFDGAAQTRHAAAARAESLARALEELQGTGGRAELEGAEGVLGSLVDLVDVDDGWEQAFDAAVGAAAAAVVVAGRQAARDALARLRVKKVAGAVLAASGRPGTPPGAESPLAPPAGAEPLRHHIRPAAGSEDLGLDAILDMVVGSAVRVRGWEEAMDLASEQPDLVVVTPEGDRFSASGWRLRSGNALVTATGVAEAERRAADAVAQAAAADAALRAARVAHEEARTAATGAERAVVHAETQLAAVVSEGARLDDERARAAADLDASIQARAELAARHEAETRSLAQIEERLPALQDAAAAAVARAAGLRAALAALAERRQALAEQVRAQDVRLAAVEERRRVLTERKAEVERRLSGHADERAAAAARRSRLEAGMGALAALDELVGRHRVRAEGVLDGLRQDYERQVDAVRAGGARLEMLRRDRVGAERRLEEVRRRLGTLEIEEAEIGLRAGALAEAVEREAHGQPLADEIGDTCPDVPDGMDPSAYAATLDGKLAELGPVNPLALEELSVLEERHQDLARQVDDVRSARRELHQVIRALDEEIMAAFAAAAADVNEHFSSLVAMLFPGGTGRLELTEPDDLLNTGVEIEVRPAGRNVRRVSLLSGGERSLAALAFLFAVFRSRPSPFYLMDEVEAALDDVNLTRFLGLVREFRAEAQLIIVSHQKRTMETGDALYGVTMAPGGSSQVVSQKVRTLRPPSTPSAVHGAPGVEIS